MLVDIDCPRRFSYEYEGNDEFDHDRMKRRVQTLSCGLAELTGENYDDAVVFIHQSAKDFFLEKGLLILEGRCASTEEAIGMGHFRLFRTCIRCLVMEDLGQFISSLYNKSDEDSDSDSGTDVDAYLDVEYPLLRYAATSWIKHLENSKASNVPPEDILELFGWPSNSVMEQWFRVARELGEWPGFNIVGGLQLIHVLSGQEMLGPLRAILQREDEIGAGIEARNSYGWTPLHYAIEQGRGAAVELLLDKGADIESVREDGVTPLAMAAHEGRDAIVQLLLSRGADVHSANKEGKTPLMSAAQNGSDLAVQLLLSKGADVGLVDEDGRTALSWASGGGHPAVVQRLLNSGADIESADYQGRTPLSWASGIRYLWRSFSADTSTVQLLLDNGADVEAADHQGRTPLWWVSKKSSQGIFQLLLNNGADINSADK